METYWSRITKRKENCRDPLLIFYDKLVETAIVQTQTHLYILFRNFKLRYCLNCIMFMNCCTFVKCIIEGEPETVI